MPRLAALLGTAILAVAARGAVTCNDIIQNATSVITATGTNIVCCKTTEAACVTLDAIPENECDQSPYPADAQCVVTFGYKACSIDYDNDAPDGLCGNYDGAVGAPGVTVAIGAGATDLNITVVQQSVLGNWPNLGLIDTNSLCCTGAPTTCQDGTNDDVTRNSCPAGQYQLLCAGDTLHGICSVFSNTTHTTELGQFLIVNAAPPASSTSVASTGSPAVTGTLSGSDTTTTTSPPVSSQILGSSSTTQSSLPTWVVALIVVLAMLTLSVIVVGWFLHRRRHRFTSVPVSPTAFEEGRPLSTFSPVIQPYTEGSTTLVPQQDAYSPAHPPVSRKQQLLMAQNRSEVSNMSSASSTYYRPDSPPLGEAPPYTP